jgi:hypothetical protein
MTIKALTPPTQLPAVPLYAPPAQLAPGGFGKGNAVPPKMVPPAPSAPKQTLQIPPEERAKAAVDAFHEVRAELGALIAKPPVDEGLKHKKEQQLIIVQNGAIEAATTNFNLKRQLAQQAEFDLGGAKIKLIGAVQEPSSSADPVGALATAENAAMLARRNLADAESLLKQAKGTPEGDRDAAHDNLRNARKHHLAEDMKLAGANFQAGPDENMVDVAQKDVEAADQRLVQAEREEKAVTDTKSQPAP